MQRFPGSECVLPPNASFANRDAIIDTESGLKLTIRALKFTDYPLKLTIRALKFTI